ncbi:MAG TPA: hypothetical protein VMZ22_08445 [Acidimicrobiales bacterium]|nr:hypothetical protein [Acidimicrobiales bacterium]
MDELATVLRRERWLLSVLVFRLTEMRHLLSANDARFLGWASTEVEDAVARVREAEMIRSALVGRLAREVEMDEADVTLACLARVAPEPYRAIFSEHRGALLEAMDEVESLAHSTSDLATLEALVGGPGDTLELQIAHCGHAAALATAERLSLSTLVEFLRELQ